MRKYCIITEVMVRQYYPFFLFIAAFMMAAMMFRTLPLAAYIAILTCIGIMVSIPIVIGVKKSDMPELRLLMFKIDLCYVAGLTFIFATFHMHIVFDLLLVIAMQILSNIVLKHYGYPIVREYLNNQIMEELSDES